MSATLVSPVDVSVHQVSPSLAFVFIGDDYAGTVERGALDIWKGYHCDTPDLDLSPSPTMYMAIGNLVILHGIHRLKAVLAL